MPDAKGLLSVQEGIQGTCLGPRRRPGVRTPLPRECREAVATSRRMWRMWPSRLPSPPSSSCSLTRCQENWGKPTLRRWHDRGLPSTDLSQLRSQLRRTCGARVCRCSAIEPTPIISKDRNAAPHAEMAGTLGGPTQVPGASEGTDPARLRRARSGDGKQRLGHRRESVHRGARPVWTREARRIERYVEPGAAKVSRNPVVPAAGKLRVGAGRRAGRCGRVNCRH
jgi:hypothetical protein